MCGRERDDRATLPRFLPRNQGLSRPRANENSTSFSGENEVSSLPLRVTAKSFARTFSGKGRQNRRERFYAGREKFCAPFSGDAGEGLPRGCPLPGLGGV